MKTRAAGITPVVLIASVVIISSVTLAIPFLSGCRGVPMETLEVSSTAFGQGEPIPITHTCDGDNLSPPLNWSAPPAGTVSFAVIMDDPDARGWVHWVLYDLPADLRGLSGGVLPDGANAAGGVHGRGNSGPGYFGPCPPESHGPHHYSFRVYALDSRLGLPANASKREVESAMEGHILASGELVGLYERSRRG